MTAGASGATDLPLADRTAALDGLRGLAVTMVFVYHVALTSHMESVAWLRDLLFQMRAGVWVFFVLSGYLIVRPFALVGGPPSAAGVRRYALRRASRIYPAYWVALLVLVLGFDYYPLQSLAEWVQAVTLTQNFTGIAYEQGRGVQQAWSLAIEVDFYVFVPAFAALVTVGAGRMGVGATRRRWWWGVGAVFVVGAVWQLIARETLVPLFMLPNYFPAFGSGMALALLSVDMPARLAPITARLGAARGMLGVAAVGVLGLRAWVFTAPEGFAAKQGPEAQLWFTLFAVLVVAPLVWSLDRPGLLARRVPAALGTVSYGVFLWHLAMLQSWSPVDFGFGEDLRFNPVVRGLLFGALSLAVATVSWFLVERPILRWSHRRSA